MIMNIENKSQEPTHGETHVLALFILKEVNHLAGAIGRPPKYKNVEEIEEKIEQYFKECEGKIAEDVNGNPMYTKSGNPCWKKAPTPPTVTGLALALGFTCRRDLLNYQGKKEFCNTITRAKSLVEKYTEERLFDRDGTSGAQFSLRNNFKGWKDDEEKRLEIELLKAESQLKNIVTEEHTDNNFLEALNHSVKEVWRDSADGN